MPREIVGHERISRFLFSSGELTKTVVKARAFDPRKHNEVSICCSDGLTEDQIWSLAQLVLDSKRLQNPAIRLHGRGDFFASEVLEATLRTPEGILTGLRIIQDDIGWERHGGIQNWPPNDEVRGWISQIIASKCKLENFPPA
jgi:hypothetical protein